MVYAVLHAFDGYAGRVQWWLDIEHPQNARHVQQQGVPREMTPNADSSMLRSATVSSVLGAMMNTFAQTRR